jgi:hypothetical protein
MLYFSPKFRDRISEIDSDISKELLKSEFTEIKPDMTFIDVDDNKEGFITFTQIKNAQKKFQDQFQDSDLISGKGIDKSLLKFLSNLYDPQLNKSNPFVQSRNYSKLGRFINKTFPGKFKDKEVEDFVNKFKSKFEKEEERFKIVDGDDILYYYLCDNYSSTYGTLDSCMAADDAQEYIQWYADNPKSVNLLVYLDKDGLVKGRALLWNISHAKGDKKFDIFMDRVYYDEDHLVDKFISYAKENGFAYKESQNFGESVIIFNSKDHTLPYYIKMNGNPDEYFPYLDTFMYYNSDTYTLSNQPFDHDLVLDSDLGGSERVRGEYIGEFSNFYNRYIPAIDTICSEHLQDYIYDNMSKYSNYHNSYIPTESAVWSKNLDSYLYKDHSVYSDKFETYIPRDKPELIYGDSKEEVFKTIKEGIEKLVESEIFKTEYKSLKSSPNYKDVDVANRGEMKSDIFDIIKMNAKEPKVDKDNKLSLKLFNDISGKDYTWNQFTFVNVLFVLSIMKGSFYIGGVKHLLSTREDGSKSVHLKYLYEFLKKYID